MCIGHPRPGSSAGPGPAGCRRTEAGVRTVPPLRLGPGQDLDDRQAQDTGHGLAQYLRGIRSGDARALRWNADHGTRRYHGRPGSDQACQPGRELDQQRLVEGADLLPRLDSRSVRSAPRASPDAQSRPGLVRRPEPPCRLPEPPGAPLDRYQRSPSHDAIMCESVKPGVTGMHSVGGQAGAGGIGVACSNQSIPCWSRTHWQYSPPGSKSRQTSGRSS
jgi:hypothetical protein